MRFVVAVFAALMTVLALVAADAAPVQASAQPAVAASDYRLFSRDLVRVSVHGEPDLKDLDRRIDGSGRISLPLLPPVDLKGLTPAEAEVAIARAFIEAQILLRPQVSVTVVEYSPREISVLGQVRTPGKIAFPIEADSLSIVEAVSKAGGFTRIAKSDSVLVTRTGADGREISTTVDVARLFDGRGGGETYQLVPGDVVFVPERIF